jgi:hypothetical protein
LPGREPLRRPSAGEEFALEGKDPKQVSALRRLGGVGGERAARVMTQHEVLQFGVERQHRSRIERQDALVNMYPFRYTASSGKDCST